MYAAEGTENFVHGSDFVLRDYLKYRKPADEKIVALLSSSLQEFLRRSDPSHHADPVAADGNAEREEIVAELSRDTNHGVLRRVIRLLLQAARPGPMDELSPLWNVIDDYDIIHFTGVNSMRYFYFFNWHLFGTMPIVWDIRLLKQLGKKIVFTITGCHDGVSQTAFRRWGPEPVCDICRWKDNPDVCSDKSNLAWGKLRNELSDYIVNLGGNNVDHNDSPIVHEVPEFYCLDTNVWKPDLLVPTNYALPYPSETVKIFHSVGNFDSRTEAGSQKNIKCTHIIIPVVERLKREGHKVELLFFNDVPNFKLRYYQSQADIFVDMLTYGFYGATMREFWMLGKPTVCFLRPEWLNRMKLEVPEYVRDLPAVNATPETVYAVLKDLITHPEKRRAIGARSREFAVRWHSANAGAKRLDEIYSRLLYT